jgi:hypothetical protein
LRQGEALSAEEVAPSAPPPRQPARQVSSSPVKASQAAASLGDGISFTVQWFVARQGRPRR